MPLPSTFFFNDTATTEIYTLSLHDALPISSRPPVSILTDDSPSTSHATTPRRDRKSTRLNSSHQIISYAVFCLKKKKSIVDHVWRNHAVLPRRRNWLIFVPSSEPRAADDRQ